MPPPRAPSFWSLICAQQILSDQQYTATLTGSDCNRILHVVLEALRAVTEDAPVAQLGLSIVALLGASSDALAACVVAAEAGATAAAVAERFKDDKIVARTARAIVSADYALAQAQDDESDSDGADEGAASGAPAAAGAAAQPKQAAWEEEDDSEGADNDAAPAGVRQRAAGGRAGGGDDDSSGADAD